MEADFPPGLAGPAGGDEAFNSVEHDAKLFVVLIFQGLDFAGKIPPNKNSASEWTPEVGVGRIENRLLEEVTESRAVLASLPNQRGLVLANNAVESVDLRILRLGQFLFRNGTVGVKKFRLGVEFEFAAQKYNARV